MVSAAVALILVVLGQVAGQDYSTYGVFTQQPVVPVTLTETVTKTRTIRVTTTSDVWVSSLAQQTVTATQLSTQYRFTPSNPDTVTSILTVTNTPVSVVRHTVGSNPVRTVTLVLTSFLTETERTDLYNTVTHFDVLHQIKTVPVSSVQTLYQRRTSETLSMVTVTVTSTIHGYGY